MVQIILKSTNIEHGLFFFFFKEQREKFDHDPKKVWMKLKHAIYVMSKNEPKPENQNVK